MCHGVTKSGSPTPSEITPGVPCTMSKNSRMPDRGIPATCAATKLSGLKFFDIVIHRRIATAANQHRPLYSPLATANLSSFLRLLPLIHHLPMHVVMPERDVPAVRRHAQ